MIKIEIMMKKDDSFVQFYRWQFKSLWSESLDYTEGYSKLTGILKPNDENNLNYVFKGSTPSSLSLLLTPVYFHDKYSNKSMAGYRISQKAYRRGSSRNEFNFYSVHNGVKIDFEFLFATNFYEINIKKQIELLDFFAFILGFLAGFSFLSKVAKNFMESFMIFDHTIESYQEFLDEKEKEKDEKSRNENKVEVKVENNLNQPDSIAHLSPHQGKEDFKKK